MDSPQQQNLIATPATALLAAHRNVGSAVVIQN